MFLNSGFTHPHTSASTLPQAGGQWKVRRAREHVAQRGRTEWVWEWEQGFDQGWAAATDFWNRVSRARARLPPASRAGAEHD